MLARHQTVEDDRCSPVEDDSREDGRNGVPVSDAGRRRPSTRALGFRLRIAELKGASAPLHRRLEGGRTSEDEAIRLALNRSHVFAVSGLDRSEAAVRE
jgi:hypothetical protein